MQQSPEDSKSVTPTHSDPIPTKSKKGTPKRDLTWLLKQGLGIEVIAHFAGVQPATVRKWKSKAGPGQRHANKIRELKALVAWWKVQHRKLSELEHAILCDQADQIGADLSLKAEAPSKNVAPKPKAKDIDTSSKEVAIAFYNSHWWQGKSWEEIVEKQSQYDFLVCPFELYYVALWHVLGHPPKHVHLENPLFALQAKKDSEAAAIAEPPQPLGEAEAYHLCRKSMGLSEKPPEGDP